MKKGWKLYRKKGKQNTRYTSLEVVKIEKCIEPVKAVETDQSEPDNNTTLTTPEIPNATEQATAPPQGNCLYLELASAEYIQIYVSEHTIYHIL